VSALSAEWLPAGRVWRISSWSQKSATLSLFIAAPTNSNSWSACVSSSLPRKFSHWLSISGWGSIKMSTSQAAATESSNAANLVCSVGLFLATLAKQASYVASSSKPVGVSALSAEWLPAGRVWRISSWSQKSATLSSFIAAPTNSNSWSACASSSLPRKFSHWLSISGWGSIKMSRPQAAATESSNEAYLVFSVAWLLATLAKQAS